MSRPARLHLWVAPCPFFLDYNTAANPVKRNPSSETFIRVLTSASESTTCIISHDYRSNSSTLGAKWKVKLTVGSTPRRPSKDICEANRRTGHGRYQTKIGGIPGLREKEAFYQGLATSRRIEWAPCEVSVSWAVNHELLPGSDGLPGSPFFLAAHTLALGMLCHNNRCTD